VVSARGNRVVIGVTDYAQQQLGDVVFVELPPWAPRSNAANRRRDRVGEAVSDLTHR